eukprot:UN31285
MMTGNWHDITRREVKTGNRTINGVMSPTWDVYMTAVIETWHGYMAESDVVDANTPNRLKINMERPLYYEIPFIVSFPQQITIVANPIHIYA